MSEAVAYTTELDSPPDLAEKEATNEASSLFPRLDGELTPLVMANAKVIVRPSWMGGAEVSLGEAMLNYPRRMTEEMADEVIAEVYGLLANRVIEEEEPDKEEQNQEDEAAKSDEVEDREAHEEPAQIEEEKPKPDDKVEAENPKPETAAYSKPTQAESQTAEPAEPDQPELIVAAEKTTPPGAAKPQPAQAVEASPKAETVLSASTDSKASELVPSNNKILKNSTAEPALHLARAETVENEKPEVFDIPEKSEIVDELETSKIEIPDIQSLDSLPEPLIMAGEDEAVQDELEIETLEYYETEEETLIDLTEQEEIFIDHQEIELTLDDQIIEPLIVLEAEEAEVIQLEAYTHERIETEVSEGMAVEIEEIEKALALIPELIEASEPEIVEAANRTLDKIAEVAGRLEQQNVEETITEAEAQEELEVLFMELFDLLGIEYTPELIESLAHRTVQLHSADLSKAVEAEEDEPQDEGTHEIIKKLLSGTSHTQKIMENVSAIGKSALQLTIYDFRTELRKRLAA